MGTRDGNQINKEEWNFSFSKLNIACSLGNPGKVKI
jgi:hypothetical protein